MTARSSPSSPSRSYTLRFSESLRISYACATSWNLSAASRSPWFLSAPRCRVGCSASAQPLHSQQHTHTWMVLQTELAVRTLDFGSTGIAIHSQHCCPRPRPRTTVSHPPPHTSTTHAAGQHLMAPTLWTQHMARDAPAYKSAADTTAAASRTTRANKLAPRAMLHGFQVAQHWEEHEQQGFTGPQHVLQQTTARSRRTEWWGHRPLFFGDVLAHMHGWRDSDDRWKITVQ